MSAAEPDPHLVCSAVAPSEAAVRFDPAWRTSTVLALAAGIARDGNFDAMPILADALEDAGCDNQSMLNHCRQCANHTNVCWVLPPILTASPIPPPPKEPSVFVEAVRHMGDPTYTPPASWQRVFVVSLVLLCFGLFIWLLTLVRPGERLVYDDAKAALITVSCITVGMGLVILGLHYLYSVLIVLRRRRTRRHKRT